MHVTIVPTVPYNLAFASTSVATMPQYCIIEGMVQVFLTCLTSCHLSVFAPLCN